MKNIYPFLMLLMLPAAAVMCFWENGIPLPKAEHTAAEILMLVAFCYVEYRLAWANEVRNLRDAQASSVFLPFRYEEKRPGIWDIHFEDGQDGRDVRIAPRDMEIPAGNISAKLSLFLPGALKKTNINAEMRSK